MTVSRNSQQSFQTHIITGDDVGLKMWGKKHNIMQFLSMSVPVKSLSN